MKTWISVKTVALSAVLGSACGGSSALTASLSETAQALSTAQCTAVADSVDQASCFAAFDSCQSAEGADAKACRDALHECLPQQPGRAEGHGPPRAGDGGCGAGEGPHGPPGGGRGGPGRGDGHGPDDGARPAGPPPGHRLHFGAPDAQALAVCDEALKSCQDAGTDVGTCRSTHRECGRVAFQAAFEAACAEAETRCATDTSDAEACAKILARCEQGVEGRPADETCE